MRSTAIPSFAALMLAALTHPLDASEATTKIRAADATPLKFFGASVATSGGRALVGAPRVSTPPGSNNGAAYLFDAGGVQQAKLIPVPNSHGFVFGTSVALDGDTAVIGAPFIHEFAQPGTAYVFDASTALLVTTLLAADGAPGDQFGISVDVSGSVAIVGAFADDDFGSKSGAAYLFDTSTGAQLAKLLPDDGAAGDGFGMSVAIDGNLAVVGAQFGDGLATNSGSAYVFDVTTGAQLHELVATDGATNDYFGLDVDISGTKVLVGAMFDDDGGNASGAAYVFDATTGAQLTKITPDDSTSDQWFGISVALGDALAVIGAERDDGAAVESGSAYLFDATTFAQVSKYTAADAAHADRLGNAVAVDGTFVVLGASCDDPVKGPGADSGAAYLVDLDPPTWLNEGHGLAGTAGVPTLVGTGDLVAGNPFSIALSGARPSAAATFVLGLTNVNVPFKGGVMLPTPNLIVPGFLTDGAGGIVLASNFGAGVPSGSVFHVQYWIVDPAGPAGFAASEALRGVTP